jgi:hypothetical protein
MFARLIHTKRQRYGPLRETLGVCCIWLCVAISLSYIFPETAGGEEGDHKMAAV